MRKHQGLCDKHCPKCNNPKSVEYISNMCASTPNSKLFFDCIDVGYFQCKLCGWKSKIETSRMYFSSEKINREVENK